MNASEFMEKQIQSLAASGSARRVFVPALCRQRATTRAGPSTTAEQPTRCCPATTSNPSAPPRLPPSAVSAGSPPATGAWGSLDTKPASSGGKVLSAGALEPHVLKKVSHEEERNNFNAVTIVDIDHTMMKYSDNLLPALEGVSSRLSQLEDRTHHLENSVGELKLTIGNYNGSTDGKLRQFENVLNEVQAGVQILRDKQEIVETQIQLAKFKAPKAEDAKSENMVLFRATHGSSLFLPSQPFNSKAKPLPRRNHRQQCLAQPPRLHPQFKTQHSSLVIYHIHRRNQFRLFNLLHPCQPYPRNRITQHPQSRLRPFTSNTRLHQLSAASGSTAISARVLSNPASVCSILSTLPGSDPQKAGTALWYIYSGDQLPSVPTRQDEVHHGDTPAESCDDCQTRWNSAVASTVASDRYHGTRRHARRDGSRTRLDGTK